MDKAEFKKRVAAMAEKHTARVFEEAEQSRRSRT
jgi:hypothetical protein